MGAMPLANFDKEFIERTKKLNQSYRGVYTTTLLLNSLVALIILPNEFIKKIEEITNKKIINKIEEAEIIGAKHLTDIMVIAPCSRKHNWKTSKWNCRYTSTYGSKIKLKK